MSSADVLSQRQFVDRDPPAVFRPKPSGFWLGVVGTVIFITAQAATIVGIVFDPPPRHAGLAALAVGLAWLPFVGIGLLTIAQSRRAAVVVDNAVVRIQGVIRTRQLSFNEITAIRWWSGRNWLTLCADRENLKVDLDALRPGDRPRLADLFRRQFPARIQQGWDQRWERIATERPATERLAKVDSDFRALTHMTLAWGPASGVACGAWLAWFGGTEGPSPGWLILKWGALGLSVSAVIASLLWGFRCAERLDNRA